MKEVMLAFFDTETTGIPKHPNAKPHLQPKMIEFAGVLVDSDGEEVATVELLFNPGEPLEPIITKITGLVDEDLKDQKTFPHHQGRLRAFFGLADAAIAHNLPFDSTIIDLEVERWNADPWPWPPWMICTVQEQTEEWGRRPKLEQWYREVTGCPWSQKHRALDDVRAMVAATRDSGVLDEIISAIEASR